jgi:hypothetical protein
MTASSICLRFGRLQSNGTRSRAHCNRTPQFRQTIRAGRVRARAAAARASGPAVPASTSNARQAPATKPVHNPTLAPRRKHLNPRLGFGPARTVIDIPGEDGASKKGRWLAFGGWSAAVVREVLDDLALERVRG